MNILVVTQYFQPENFRINDLVSGLVARGHAVTVLTGQPNYPSGKFFDGYGFGKKSEETLLGARVIRVGLLPRGDGGGWRLALNYLSFMVSACMGVLFRLRGPFDAIFVFQVSPITVGVPAMLARLRFGAPLVMWILDLWPDSLVAAGQVKSRAMLGAVGWLARTIYRACDIILLSSRGFTADVTKHVRSAANVRYFPNWIEPAYDGVQDNALPPLPDGVRIVFAGNLGAAQDLPAILEAASAVRDLPQVQWIFAGDGRMAEWARNEVNARGLAAQVHFLGQLPATKMPALFQAADALLVSLTPDPLFAKTVPGKVQSYLASGRPILAMLDGEGAQLVSEAGAGWVCPAGASSALANHVRSLTKTAPDERARMGQAGQAYARVNFDRETLFNQLQEWLNEAARNSRTPQK